MNRTTVHLEDAQARAVEEIVRESSRREDFPDLTQSEVLRRLVDRGLENDPEAADLVSEPTAIRLRKERFMAEDGWLRNQRTGFETQVKRHFRNRFENGYRPEQLEEWAANMRMQAEILWPRDFGEEDHSDRREEALEYVEALLEAAMEAAEVSDHDPLDPEEAFANHEGVEKGLSRDRFPDLVDAAELILRDRIGAGAKIDHEAIASAVSNEEGVAESLALEAVEVAHKQILSGGGHD